MKSITLLAALFSVSTAIALTSGSKDNPVYKQCVVALPSGDEAGICKETGQKHFQFLNCKGELQAFVEPGALPTLYETTCGATHVGFPGAK